MRWEAEPARDRPLRVAVVGLGSAATRAHLPALRELESAGRVRVVGACDRDPGRCAAVVRAHPGAQGFADNDAMLAAVAPDLLVIATPPSAHLGEIAAAVSAGVHVLCEKPLGLSDGDAATLGDLARAHPDLAIATVNQYRYAAPWSWMARAVSGAVRGGEPFGIEVTVERPGTDPLSAGGWRADPEHEGGILGDHAVHYVSLLRLLDPRCGVVSCHREGPGGSESATVRLRVGDAGVADVQTSYAGSHRANHVRLERPAQCLEMDWSDDTLVITRDGRAGAGRTVPSLSDRNVVNALYTPMYSALVDGIDGAGWRTRATEHTVGASMLLATALRLSRDEG